MQVIHGAERLQLQGEQIRMARASVRMSRDAFAASISEEMKYATVSRDLIRRIESGERDAEIGLLLAIQAVTGKRVEWLAGARDAVADLEDRYAPVAAFVGIAA